jgi:hypothetical protein
MRSIGLTGLVLLASLQVGAQVSQTAEDKSHDVINLENAWNQAVAVHDERALKELLATTFVVTDNDGRFMDRDQWLRRVRIETKDNRGPATITQTAHVYGDVVVVTGTLLDNENQRGERRSSQPIYGYLDFTEPPLGMCSESDYTGNSLTDCEACGIFSVEFVLRQGSHVDRPSSLF